MNYISFIDILGTKNSSENENFEDYLELVKNFQYELIKQSDILKESGRIHFFSDCAYIESKDIKALISYLINLRRQLLETNIFIRGSLVKGSLGAINGSESEDFFSEFYGNNLIDEFKRTRNLIKSRNKIINGTAFLSKDLSKAYYYETTIKAASIYVEDSLTKTKEIAAFFVRSGYLKDINTSQYTSFDDIRYEEGFISDEFIENILNQYTIANSSDISYGRYYLSILITCIYSSDFSSLVYDQDNDEFLEAPVIFYWVLKLRKSFATLYNNAKGLEFLYFKLIDKVYADLKVRNESTKYLLLHVFRNKKYLSKYQNKLASISKDVIAPGNKNLLQKDYNELLREKIL